MLRELLSIFRSDDPLGRLAKNFAKMLRFAEEATVKAGDIYFNPAAVTAEERTAMYEQDRKINKLERKIRKRVVAHLTIASNTQAVPYCLLLMSLVKDAERIGDYAKNLSEVPQLGTSPLPDDDVVAELREIRSGVEENFERALDVFDQSDVETAAELIRAGRDLTQRCEALVRRIARSEYDAGTTAVTILGARFYKRIAGHVLNVLSGVVMPLHKLDYYDERELPGGEEDGE